MSDKWARLGTEILLENPYYRVRRDQYRLPDGGTGTYDYVDLPGSTMIVPVLDDGTLVLVDQFRYLAGRQSLEFPAGGVKRGVERLENAQIELREEAGYRAARWEAVGSFAPYNGVSNELCTVYLARQLSAVGAAPEATEEMEVCLLDRRAVAAQIAAGKIWDGMTIAAFSLWEHWRSD